MEMEVIAVKNKIKNTLIDFGILCLTLFLIEIIFKLVSGLNVFSWSTLRIILGILIVGLIISIPEYFLRRKHRAIINTILVFIITIYTIAQAGFSNFLGVYISFGTSNQAGAVTSYLFDYIASFKWYFYFIILPFILMVGTYIYLKKHPKKEMLLKKKLSKKERLKLAALNKKYKKIFVCSWVLCLLVCTCLYYLTLTSSFMQDKYQAENNTELFMNVNMPNLAIREFGTMGYGILDLRALFFNKNDDVDLSFNNDPKIDSEKEYEREIDDTIYEDILANEKNTNYKTLHEYFLSKSITPKNDYTGMFKGKNLIIVQMESISNLLLMKEYYPNFNKLWDEGWAFTNMYSPRNACATGNNEMSAMISLFPENLSCTANIYQNNVYPYSIFNMFNNNGYTTSSFHNYIDAYYYRKNIHENMGSTYYNAIDMGIPYSYEYEEWPSDELLMEKSFEIFKSDKPFFAYLTTVSGHQPYIVSSTIGDEYLDLFKDLNVNMAVKRYLSKLKDFDNAVGVLIDELKKAKMLDNTVILFFADHYPYAIAKNNLQPLFDYDLEEYNNVDKTPMLIYNPKLESEKITSYTTFMNILPTILNLYDIDYDPRYYAGEDIFSDTYDNLAVFNDGSWVSDIAYYNATSSKIEYFTDKTYTNEEILSINNKINNKIKMSNLAIRTNYFNYLDKQFKERNSES